MDEAFGKYNLVRRIGVGGMAEAFVARKTGVEGFVKDLVIKRILPALNEDPEFVEMFINEARLAARLQHANIVQVHDFDNTDGSYYIAMEWVDGTDLRRVWSAARRRDMPVPISLAVHVAAEALKGLHYAHTKTERGKPLGLVHRDISPHNILISFSGEVKITDFGIAKAAALAHSTRGGVVKGKLPYMSPEQVVGQKVDARSDLFSLGIVLWELLAGQRLYDGQSTAELIAQVKQGRIPSIRGINREVSAELEAILSKMLAFSVDQRYATAADALGELSPHAVVAQALDAAKYLVRLMPQEANRERKGETRKLELEAGQGTVTPAPPDAPTRTRERDAPPAPAAETPPGAQARPTTPSGSSSHRKGTLGLALACLACAGLFGVLGWWFTRPSASGTQTGQLARLRVTSTPPAASISINGVTMGPSPLVVEGRPGSTLLVEARAGAARASQRATMISANGQLRLTLREPAAAPAAPRTTADRPDAAVRKAPAARRRRGTSARNTPARARGVGTLDIHVYPWARVKIDGKAVGQTPLKNFQLPAGVHTVEVYNLELNRRKRFKKRIVSGKPAPPIKLDWSN